MEYTRIDILFKEIIENNSIKPDELWHHIYSEAYNLSCEHGNAEYLLWLHDNVDCENISECMDKAAANGHLHIMKILQSWDIQCSKHTLEVAKDHAHIIEYLNEQGIS